MPDKSNKPHKKAEKKKPEPDFVYDPEKHTGETSEKFLANE